MPFFAHIPRFGFVHRKPGTGQPCLLISRIVDGGLLDQWNQAHAKEGALQVEVIGRQQSVSRNNVSQNPGQEMVNGACWSHGLDGLDVPGSEASKGEISFREDTWFENYSVFTHRLRCVGCSSVAYCHRE